MRMRRCLGHIVVDKFYEAVEKEIIARKIKKDSKLIKAGNIFFEGEELSFE